MIDAIALEGCGFQNRNKMCMYMYMGAARRSDVSDTSAILELMPYSTILTLPLSSEHVPYTKTPPEIGLKVS